jgi:hypothetical protein
VHAASRTHGSAVRRRTRQDENRYCGEETNGALTRRDRDWPRLPDTVATPSDSHAGCQPEAAHPRALGTCQASAQNAAPGRAADISTSHATAAALGGGQNPRSTLTSASTSTLREPRSPASILTAP